MLRNQGKAQQQLVFHQLAQIELATQRQYIVFALSVEFGRCRFALYKQKAALGREGHRDGLQAALAHKLKVRAGAQMKPCLYGAGFPLASFAPDRPVNLFASGNRGFAMLHVGKPVQRCERPMPSELACCIGECRHVEAAWVERTLCHPRSLVVPEAAPSLLANPNGTMRAMVSPPLPSLQLPPQLILASTSRYRRELLERLRLPFLMIAPQVDETPGDGEAPAALAQRLAQAKAAAVSAAHPHAVVIGSDQVADLDGVAIGKPGTHERATQQLRAMSGRAIVFQTAVTVSCRSRGFEATSLVPVTVRFRSLSATEIEHYLRAEQPYDCAGSAKVETLGIALIEALHADDPTALVGLPLIQTCALLRRAGIDPLGGAGTAS